MNIKPLNLAEQYQSDQIWLMSAKTQTKVELPLLVDPYLANGEHNRPLLQYSHLGSFPKWLSGYTPEYVHI